MKNKLFTLEISRTKTILRKFWKANKIFIKQKWRERANESREFTMFIVNFWPMRMFLFCDFIIKYIKFKLEKGGETQFCKNFLKETNFSSNKNDVSERVKVGSLRCLSWTFWQMRMFLLLGFYYWIC